MVSQHVHKNLAAGHQSPIGNSKKVGNNHNKCLNDKAFSCIEIENVANSMDFNHKVSNNLFVCFLAYNLSSLLNQRLV